MFLVMVEPLLCTTRHYCFYRIRDVSGKMVGRVLDRNVAKRILLRDLRVIVEARRAMAEQQAQPLSFGVKYPISSCTRTPIMDPEPPLVAIAGLIAVGKSHLSHKLAEKLGLPLFQESVNENEILKKFYEDQKTYSFELQVSLLNQRYKQQQQIVWDGEGGVQDRSIYEDEIFARMLTEAGLMTDQQYRIYEDLKRNMVKGLTKPNLIVYLKAPAAICHARMLSRGREMECKVSLEYLEVLENAYDIYMAEISKIIPVITGMIALVLMTVPFVYRF
jgi:deoxyadenosine kinase